MFEITPSGCKDIGIRKLKFCGKYSIPLHQLIFCQVFQEVLKKLKQRSPKLTF